MPEKQNLPELFGFSEVPVLSEVYGHFVNSLAENSLLEDGSASQVDEATLSESIRAGRTFSRESLAALARTEQAKAQTGQAFGLLLPSIRVHANSGAEKSEPSVVTDENTGELIASDTHSRTDASFVLRQALFDLPSYLDWRRREVVETARGEDYRATDGDTYLATVNAYLSLVSTRLQTYALRDFETQLDELLLYIEKRANAGAASVSDMARVKARSEETLSFRLEQESDHAATWVEFVRLTNLAPQKVRLPVIEDVGGTSLPESFDRAVAVAMRSNPEISALTAEVQAAKIDREVAKGRYLPRLDAEYSYNYSLHAGGDESSSGQKDQRIMAVLNWDLFSGGSDIRYYDERTARYKELQYRLDDQRRRVVQGLSANYAVLVTTRERIASGYQELKSISTAAEAMSKRMLSANQSLLDMLDVYDRLFRARSRLVNLHVLEMNTVAQLVRLTMGTPWAKDKETPFGLSGEIPASQLSEQDPSDGPGRFLQVGEKEEQGELSIITRHEVNGGSSQPMDPLAAPSVPTDVMPAPEVVVPPAVMAVEQSPSALPEETPEDRPEDRPEELSPSASGDINPPEYVQTLRESGSGSGKSSAPMMAPVTQAPTERAVVSALEPSAKKMVLGVVADPDSLLETSQQAEPLAAYLEASLPLSISVREFTDMAGFTEWFIRHRMVDLAILSPSAAKDKLGRDYLSIAEVLRTDKPGIDPAGLVVVPRGQNDEMAARLQRVLVEMPETADGRSLLNSLKIIEISAPKVVPARSVEVLPSPEVAVPPTVMAVEKSPRALPEERKRGLYPPASGDISPPEDVQNLRESGFESGESIAPMMAPVTQAPTERAVVSALEPSAKKMVLGVVADPDSLLETSQQAEPLAAYLEASLPLSISVREFTDMAGFTEWFIRHRMVDLAILSPSAAKDKLGRDYLSIAEVLRTDKPGIDPAGLVVVPRGQNDEIAEELQSVLVEMPETADGRSLLNSLKISEISVPEVAQPQPFIAPGMPY